MTDWLVTTINAVSYIFCKQYNHISQIYLFFNDQEPIWGETIRSPWTQQQMERSAGITWFVMSTESILIDQAAASVKAD